MAEPAGKPEFDPNELDPELISLKRKSAGIGPIFALSVLILCGHLIWQLRADVGYALSSEQPQAVDAVTALAGGGHAPDNRLVALTGAPDLTAPGWLRGKQAVGHRLMPILGTSGRMWLHITDDVRTPAPAYEHGYLGRTRRIDDLAFAPELRAYLRSLPPQPRHIPPEELREGTPSKDVHGDALSLAPGNDVELDERVEGVVLVTAYATDSIKDEAAARAGLAAAGLTAAPGLARSTDRSWTFEVAAANGVEPVRAQIARAGFWSASAAGSVEPKLIRHVGTWGDVTVDAAAGQVRLSDGRSIPIAQVARMVAWVPPTLPADAQVLMMGEKPGEFWYAPPLAALLALVSVFMIWAFVRAVRPAR